MAWVGSEGCGALGRVCCLHFAAWLLGGAGCPADPWYFPFISSFPPHLRLLFPAFVSPPFPDQAQRFS